jgi:F-type H+-transporting ATPase subunit beta
MASTQPQERTTETGDGKRNVGRIEEIQGVVIEAVFPEELPEIYSAIVVERAALEGQDDNISSNLVCEVQQHLGDDRVRAVAMDTTDGISRGAEVIDTGGPITVPVGRATLGRIFNLLGEAIDQGDEVQVEERWPIHRPRCSRPASRWSTCSRRTRRAARSACSAAPASARR